MVLGFVISALVTTGMVVATTGIAVVTTVVPVVASVVVNVAVGTVRTVRMGYDYYYRQSLPPSLPLPPPETPRE